MIRCLLAFLMVLGSLGSTAQISFFNMPNPDMLPDVGYAYAEYDLYQTVRDNKNVNAHVTRISYQVTPFLEVGTNLWFNKELAADPDKIVLATKWRIWLHKTEKVKISLSPGSWSTIYFSDLPVKNILYNFAGFSIQHSETIYTRLMLGGYGKFWKHAETLGQEKFTKGLIAGVEQRLSKKAVFVSDYFQGSGEGFGLATGFVFYAMNDGQNLPLYLAYQFDNDSNKNNLIIFEIGYLFQAIKRKEK